ncbi:MAG: hypothetical protein ACE5HT_04600 [Gemmatimonadales bacterium]
MLNRSKLWAAILLIAAFAAGVAVGGGTTAALGDGKAATNATSERNSTRDREHRRSYGERLQEELNLSPSQRASVDTIIQRRQTEMHNLWKEVGPKFDALRNDIRKQVMSVLDETQQEKFRELIASSDRNRERRDRNGSKHR